MQISRGFLVAFVCGSMLASSAVSVAAATLITGAQIKDRSITAVDIARNTVTSNEIKNGTLTASDFAPNTLLKGDTGAAGPQGPKGDTGLPGANGVNGGQGPAGPKGDAGTAGVDGAIGPQGPAGVKGDPGIPGADGAPGVQGPKGDPGPAGAATGVADLHLFDATGRDLGPTVFRREDCVITVVPGLHCFPSYATNPATPSQFVESIGTVSSVGALFASADCTGDILETANNGGSATELPFSYYTDDVFGHGLLQWDGGSAVTPASYYDYPVGACSPPLTSQLVAFRYVSASTTPASATYPLKQRAVFG